MATVFGSTSGPIYPLGEIIVLTPGTPVVLSTNVTLNTSWGTATGGIPGLTKSGQPSTLCCNQLVLSAPSTNTGDVFLVFKTQGYNGTGGTSVIIVIPKGTVQRVYSPQLSNPFQLDQLGIDAVNANDVCYVTAIII